MNNVLTQVGWKSQDRTTLSSEANNSWHWYYVSGWQNSLPECSDWSQNINWL